MQKIKHYKYKIRRVSFSFSKVSGPETQSFVLECSWSQAWWKTGIQVSYFWSRLFTGIVNSLFSLQYHPNIVTGSTVSEEGSIERGGIQGKSLICPAEGLEIQRLLFRTVQWSPIFSFIKYKTRGFNTFLTWRLISII